MEELIGKECSIVFSLDYSKWPIPGYPARAKVLAIDTHLVKFDHGQNGTWINKSIIQEIKQFWTEF